MSVLSQITIGRFGRILIPKAIQIRLGLTPGTTLLVEKRNDKEILLRPLREEPQLANKDGVLVVQSEAVGGIIDAERREREARMSQLMRRTGL